MPENSNESPVPGTPPVQGTPQGGQGLTQKINSAASSVGSQLFSAAAGAKEQVAGTVAAAKDQAFGATVAVRDQAVNTAVLAKEQAAAAVTAAAQVVGKVTDVTGKMMLGVNQAKELLHSKPEEGEGASNFVSVESDSDRIRRKNFYHANAALGFVWMLFHFTVVYFFGIKLESPALVGIFLGFGNLVSLVLDAPVGVLQRYFSAKKLYVIGAVSQLVAAGIFLNFIFGFLQFSKTASGGKITEFLTAFLASGSNVFFLILASLCYGLTKELNDITTLSYILNNADPSEYSEIMSKNNIWGGAGMFLGLLSAGVVLALNQTLAVVTLITFIILLMGFITTFFDNSERNIDFASIIKLKVIAQVMNLEKVKEYTVGYVTKADFASIAKGAKFLFLRPMGEKKSKFDVKEVVRESKKEVSAIWKTMLEQPLYFRMLWETSVILAFGFWDTFATSFLIEYLGKVAGNPNYAYAILGVIAIPAFVSRDLFIWIAKRTGNFPVIVFGIVASGVSIFLMSTVDSIAAVIFLGIVNSLGFAAGMGITCGQFLDSYNVFYAKKFELAEIDSNASAAPMKIIQNLANVIGLCVGGILVALVDFK